MIYIIFECHLVKQDIQMVIRINLCCHYDHNYAPVEENGDVMGFHHFQQSTRHALPALIAAVAVLPIADLA